jgi:hypothetical protein
LTTCAEGAQHAAEAIVGDRSRAALQIRSRAPFTAADPAMIAKSRHIFSRNERYRGRRSRK